MGSTTTEIAKLSVFFFRQGLAQKDALIMTEVAATAAKVASIDATESANFLTSAINGFGLASSDAMKVSDKFAALGAASASSYEELAVALSKVAPVAKVAGVGIDQMMGFLAKGVETTREAPENIGTAFKTVFARMTQLTDFGKTLEDNTSVNAVEEALALANVALRDSQGTFRNMGDVITELGLKFDGLDRNTQSYIATALAGTRQQSRLLAVLQDFGRTQELVDVSTNSAGATMRQHAAFARSMEAAMNNLTTSFQMLITKISDSQTIIDFVNMLARSIDVVGSVMGFMVNATDSAIANIGIFVTSLTVLATIFLFLRSSVIKYIATQKVQNALIAAENFLVKKQIGSKKTLATIQSLINVEQKKGLVTTLLTITSEKIRLILLKRMNIGQAALVVTNAATATSNTLVATTSKAVGVGFAAAAKGL